MTSLVAGRHQESDVDPVASGIKGLGLAVVVGVLLGLALVTFLIFLAVHFWVGGA
ncbi:MAG: hypothetical protein ACJ735_06410 [Actinomycetes bacterium]